MEQSLPLVEQLKTLERLQELDLRIDSLKKGQNSLPENLKQIDEALNKLKLNLNTKKTQFSEVEKVYKQAQAAFELNGDRLTRSNVKLESVQNSQEFQAATKEIEQLKKLNVSLEEQTKKAKQDLIQLEKEVATIGEQVEKLQTEREAQASVVTGKSNQFSSDISSLMVDRLTFSSRLGSRILSQYDKVRAARGGIGIVPAIGGRCKGCNMMLPPQLFNEIQKATILHTCPSCHRLLFVPVAVTSEVSQDLKV